MQYTVGCRAHEQGQAVAAVAANHYQISAGFFRQGVNLNFRLTEHNVSTRFTDAMARGKLFELLRGLLVNLILYSREVHGNVTAIGKAQGLDDVDDM